MNDYTIVERNAITRTIKAKSLTAAKRHATRHATWCHPEISIHDITGLTLTQKGLATGHQWLDK